MSQLTQQWVVGPYRLLSIIGKGGMGNVWKAQHTSQGYIAAIKIIHAAQHADAQYRQAFQREVDAVAKLYHPNICQVLDYGQVNASTAAHSKGALIEGSSWLAMTFTEHGTLDQQMPFLQWAAIKDSLHQILQGLAHAHARGVIHRDIKPQNILVDFRDKRPTYLLTDFGLAHPTMRVMSNRTMQFYQTVAGTPHYMPPEQIRGKWRDYGPWTDLYALGCVAYELCCHRPPFSGKTVLDLASQHLQSPQPEFRPKIAVPFGMDRWIAQLMQKDPFARPERAADALHALQQLDDAPVLTSETWSEISEVIDATTEMLSDQDVESLQKIDSSVANSVDLGSHSLNIWSPLDAVDMTLEDVGRQETIGPQLQMVQVQNGAQKHIIPGLGLFGLRDLPLVGRTDEFSRLWHALEDVSSHQHTQVLLIHGPSGVGKSKLASWLIQRADEVGAATSLKLEVHKDEPLANSMRNMLQSRLRCQGLDYKETLKRAMLFLGYALDTDSPQEVLQSRALAQLMSEPNTKEAQQIHFSSDRERNLALLPVLLKLSRTRPLILWIEDAEQHVGSLSALLDLLSFEQVHQQKLLVVVTYTLNDKDTTLTKMPQLGALVDSTSPIQIALEPLNDQALLHFVNHLLDFEPDTAKSLVMRSKGLPLIALQTIKAWVADNQLTPGPRGFRLLNPSRHTQQLESLEDLWHARLEHLASNKYPNMIPAMELAAAHGQNIPQMTWTILCTRCGYTPVNNLLDTLARQGFITISGTGFSFAHAHLESYLEQSARTHNRWKRHHDVWANQMMTTPNANSTDWLLRLSHHLYHARDYERAADVSRDAGKLLHEQSDYVSALDALERERACYDALKTSITAPRRVACRVFEAEISRHLGDYRQSGVLLQEALKHVEPGTLTQADAYRLMAMLNLTGDNTQIVRLYIQQAHDIYQKHNNDKGLGLLYHTEGWYRLNQHLDGSYEAFSLAIKHAQRANDLLAEAWGRQGQAEHHLRHLQIKQARQHAQRAMEQFGQTNSRAGTCLSLCNLSEIGMFEQNIPVMLRLADQGKDVAASAGSVLIVYAAMLRGVAATLLGDPNTALRRLQAVIDQVPASIHYNIFIMARLSKAFAAIQLQQFDLATATYENVLVHLHQRPTSLIHFFHILHHTHQARMKHRFAPNELKLAYVEVRNAMLRHASPSLNKLASRYDL